MVKIWVKTSRCNAYTNIYHTAQQFMEKNDFVVSLVFGNYFIKKEKKEQNTHIRRDKNTPNSTSIINIYINTIVYYINMK